MRERRGAALAVVLAAVLLMAMVVAVGAQRALVTARQASLELARAELLAATVSAQAAALEAPADSVCCPAYSPGAQIAAGAERAGGAWARWSLIGAAPPYVTVEIETEAAVRGGIARASHRALAVWTLDSVAGPRWAIVAGLGWTKRPSR